MKAVFFFFLLLPLGNLEAISLDCNDPDMVFCMDLADGDGLVAIDRSQTGATGTLNGGPAWMNASAAWPVWNSSLTGTNTYTLPPPHYIEFTATAGEDLTTGNTSVGDFSGGKPGMIAVIWYQKVETVGTNASVFSWGDQVTGGWSFQTSGGGGWPNAAFFLRKGVISRPFNETSLGAGSGNAIWDRLPHSYEVWWDGTNQDLYVDGKYRTTFAAGDFVASTGGFSFAKSAVGETEWAGGVWGARVWKKAVTREQAPGFFKAYHDSFLGAN